VPAEKMRRKKIIGGATPNREKSRATRLQRQSPKIAGNLHAASYCRSSAVNRLPLPRRRPQDGCGASGTNEETSSSESFSVVNSPARSNAGAWVRSDFAFRAAALEQ